MAKDLLAKLVSETFSKALEERASFLIHCFQQEHAVFGELVAKSSSERPLHNYLKAHPAVLLHAMMDGFYNVASTRSCLYSELPLGAEFCVDFAFCNGHSMGMQWIFVELERADVPLFTKSGDPSKQLSHAIRQVTDWKAWIEDHQEYALDYLHGLIKSSPMEWEWPRIFFKQPKLVIIIGRRHMLTDESNRLRIQLCRNINELEIITYDRMFDHYDIDKSESLDAKDHRAVRDFTKTDS